MISRNDCLLLLTDIQNSGVDVNSEINELLSTNTQIPMSVLKFINEHRTLDLTEFYEKLRKSYNDKKSNLYKNIVSEIKDPNDSLTTLASLNLQILLFSKKVKDKQMFLRHARLDDINKCLYNYSQTYDLTPCLRLLRLLKADLKALESIKD